jgi:hypothetical protein
MPDANLVTREKENLLYLIDASVNTNLFRHFYTSNKNGEVFDALEDGNKSCAYLVTCLLLICGHLIDGVHTTVATTLERMPASGWHESDRPVPGSIVYWPEGNGNPSHIGFYLAEDKYMSNVYTERRPVYHGPNHPADGREPTKYFVHDKLLVN